MAPFHKLYCNYIYPKVFPTFLKSHIYINCTSLMCARNWGGWWPRKVVYKSRNIHIVIMHHCNWPMYNKDIFCSPVAQGLIQPRETTKRLGRGPGDRKNALSWPVERDSTLLMHYWLVSKQVGEGYVTVQCCLVISPVKSKLVFVLALFVLFQNWFHFFTLVF